MNRVYRLRYSQRIYTAVAAPTMAHRGSDALAARRFDASAVPANVAQKIGRNSGIATKLDDFLPKSLITRSPPPTNKAKQRKGERKWGARTKIIRGFHSSSKDYELGLTILYRLESEKASKKILPRSVRACHRLRIRYK